MTKMLIIFTHSLAKPNTVTDQDLFGYFDITALHDNQNSLYGYVAILIRSIEDHNLVTFSNISVSDVNSSKFTQNVTRIRI